MASRDDLHELFGAYGAANDLRDTALIGQCFTAEGTFTLHIAGADTIGPLGPRDAVLDFFGQAFAAQRDQRRHVVTNLRLLEDGEDARAEAYLTLIVTDAGTTELKSAGRYDVRLAREEGEWRFRDMVLNLDSPF
jgi:SnoaL-like domain